MWCKNAILSSNNFTWGQLLKIKWLVTVVTAIESPDRTERAIFGVILGVFGQFGPLLWLGSQFEVYEPPLEP